MNKDLDSTQEDLADVSDNPEWTTEDFARSRPFHVTFPGLAAGLYADELRDIQGSSTWSPFLEPDADALARDLRNDRLDQMKDRRDV